MADEPAVADETKETKEDDQPVTIHSPDASSGLLHRMQTVHQEYAGPNPFQTLTPPGVYEYTKIALMTIAFIPIIKLLFFGLCLVFMYIFSRITICCKRDLNAPHGPLRRLWVYPIRFFMRIILIIFGFYYIPIKKPACCRNEKARIIVANHIALVDALGIFVHEGCIAAAKHDVFKTPLFGSIMYALEFIPIDRRTPDSRKKAKEEMTRKISDPRFPPLLIFPEGTTSNSKVITKFMAGAFGPGLPVQPVVIRYPHCFWDHAMIGNDLWIIWRTLCQVVNWQTLEYLPVYKPSEAEQKDPFLYADNVQKLFASKSGAESTSHSWDDVRLFVEARKLKTPANTRALVMDDFRQLVGFTYDQFKLILPRFKELDQNGDGYLDISEFCASKALTKFPPELKSKLFELIDVDGDGRVDFRGFILGVASATGRVPTQEASDLAFQVYDRNGDGKVTKEELLETITTLSAKSEEKEHVEEREKLAEKLFPTPESPPLDLESFKKVLSTHPQLIALAFAFDYLHIGSTSPPAV